MKKIITLVACLACLTVLRAQTPVSVPQLYDFNFPVDTVLSTDTVPYSGFVSVGGTFNFSRFNTCDSTLSCHIIPIMPSDSSARKAILIFPDFTVGTNDLHIAFDLYWVTFITNYCDVGYITNISDTSTFIPLYTYNQSESYVFDSTVGMYSQQGCVHHEVGFNGAPNGARIALRHREPLSLSGIAIDNLEVFVPSSCPPPTSVSVTDLTATSATVNVALDSGNTGCYLKLNDSLIGAVNTPYTLDNLVPNTEYIVEVYSLCAGDSSSRFIRTQFRTPCSTVAAPWTDDFESYTTPTLPCYDILVSPVGAQYYTRGYNYPRVVTTTPNNTSNGMKAMRLDGTVFDQTGGSHPGGAFFVCPTVDLAGDQMHVSFKYKQDATAFGTPGQTTLRAGVVTQRNDTSTFIPYKVITATDTFYHEYDFYTSNLNYDTVYAAFHWYGGMVNFAAAWLDELRIEQAGCRTPDTLFYFYDSIATDLIAMYWRPTALSYDLAYNTVNDSNSATVVHTTDTTYTLSGLTPDTKYYFWIRSYCQSDSSAWRYLGAVRTACPESFDPPYTEDFADYDPMEDPHCWTKIWTHGVYPTTVHQQNGLNYVQFIGTSYLFNVTTMIVLPYINLSYDNMWIRATGRVEHSDGLLEIGYVTNINNATGTFMPLDTIDEPTDTEHEIFTNAIPYQDSIWVALRAYREAISENYAFLKSIDVRAIPNCLRPHIVTLDTVGHTFANLSWSDMQANAYEVAYSTTDDVEASGLHSVETNFTNLTLDSLTPLTTYYTWVRSLCGNDTSIWRPGPSFTTLCGVNACTINVSMTDGTPYNTGFSIDPGFGWGVDVYTDTVLLASIGNGETDTTYLSAAVFVCPHMPLTFTFRTTLQNDMFAPAIEIADISGTVWHPSALGMATGDTLLTIANPCPSCLPVQNLELDDVSHDYFAISWTAANATDSSWIIIVDSVAVDTVNTTHYALNGLTPNTRYHVSVVTNCTDELAYERSIDVTTDCPVKHCPIEIVYTDPYGWGSLVASGLEVWTGNNLMATIVSPATSLDFSGNGPTLDTAIRICPTDSIRINQILNGISDATFIITVINGNGDTVSHSPAGEPYVSDTFALQCPCTSPEVRRTEATYNTLTVTWHGLDSIELVICEGAFNDSTGTLVATAGGSYTFTGLQPSTVYSIGLRDLCGSAWEVVVDSTLIAPCFTPDSLTVLGVGFTEATLSWVPVGEESEWEVEALGVGDTLRVTATIPSVTLQQLYPDVTYTARVRALCDAGAVPESEWSDAVQFTTDVCPPVSGLYASAITHNSATLQWSAAQNSIGYVLYYGLEGWTSAQYEATMLETVSPGTTLTGLDDSTAYDVFVLNRCAENVISTPREEYRFTFITLSTPAGIYDGTSGTLSLYPNPATRKVTVTVGGMPSSALRVEIVDMNGRTVYSTTTAGDSFILDVSMLAKGSYFVRVTGDDRTAVRKLVVK